VVGVAVAVAVAVVVVVAVGVVVGVAVAVAVAVAVVGGVAVWRQIVNAAIHVRGPALCQSHKPCAWRYGLYHLHGV
jgi:hypothetical protein